MDDVDWRKTETDKLLSAEHEDTIRAHEKEGNLLAREWIPTTIYLGPVRE